MEPQFVSIIIPAYNGSKFLSTAINSILTQTYSNWELIIVDDGSADNTKQIVQDYIKKDSRIKYYWEINSGGPARPKNTGFKYAQGDYIAYLDQDDEWLPQKIEKQLAIFAKYPNQKIGLISCGAYVINENHKPISSYIPNNKKGRRDLLIGNYIWSNSSVLLPRKIIEEVGLRDESKDIGYYEDWDMWVRIASRGYELYSIKEPLINYLVHNDNVSSKTNTSTRANQNLAFYNKHIDLYKKYHLEYVFLSRIGLSYALAGEIQIARKYYKQSIMLKKDYLVPYLGILLTYLGRVINRMAVNMYHIFKGEWSFLVFHR